MSRIGNPYDNAKAESFIKTLKLEEVDGRAYRDIDHARASIGIFIERVCNRQRLHSALAYRPPAEFEATLPPRRVAAQQPRAAEISPTCPLFSCLTTGVQFTHPEEFVDAQRQRMSRRMVARSEPVAILRHAWPCRPRGSG
jgi:hypothetical protein